MATDIPTPEEIKRVTKYLQDQAKIAQDAHIEAKRQGADMAQAAADALVTGNDVVGVEIERRAWDSESIPWQKRGDITSIRLDFSDGQQAVVAVSPDGDAIDLDIIPPG